MPPDRLRPPPTRRLVLRPGVHVLRRAAGELQVGLDPARAIVLPDRPAVRALLVSLTSPASPHDEETYDADALGLLGDTGLLCDCDILLPLVPDRPGAAAVGTTRGDVAAAAARAGDEVRTLLTSRAGSPVEVIAGGSPESIPVAGTVVGLLDAAGVPAAVADAPAAEDRGQIGVLVAVGEPDRELLDAWLRAGTPHLVLRLVEGHATVGPFVRPGETACLRCIDAHHTDVDPAWPLLVAQHAAAAARRREDSVPEPVDSCLATLAASWAARELVTACEGGEPSLSGSTVRLDPLLRALETQEWPLHAACGCAWS